MANLPIGNPLQCASAQQPHFLPGKWLQQLCLFGGFWYFDNQHPEDCLALIRPLMRDTGRAFDQHILSDRFLLIANLNEPGAGIAPRRKSSILLELQ